MFGRPPVPRQALLAATLGAVYGLLILPAPDTILGVFLPGVAWFILAMSLLFVVPIAYHVYTFWAILWVVYRGVSAFRATSFNGAAVLLDLLLPIASLALLFTSGYMLAARPNDLPSE